jgi:signal transduction histidine kinase
MKTYPGYSYALGELKALGINKRDFPEMERLNPEFIQRLIGYMTERAKTFATTQLQHEKVSALGNLAAGIAHEMNNPASAIRGISDELSRRLYRNFDLTKKLLHCSITPDHLQNIRNLVEKKDNEPAPGVKLSALQKIEKEDEIDDWLEGHGIRQRETAETFAEYGFTIDELNFIWDDLGERAFPEVIPWLENLISSKKIIRDLAEASDRISHLVTSIKSHVHMDRTNDLQPTDIHQDIENTLVLLGFKLREKSIRVEKSFDPKMPLIPAFVGELNQVWTNLIDNAIFALDKNGIINIKTSVNEKDVTISIMDNGPGIPHDILSRIFDPFFTTKKVGEGTGIGLDIVNRIIKNHNGEIRVNSEPGHTEFTVTLPLEQKEQTRQSL